MAWVEIMLVIATTLPTGTARQNPGTSSRQFIWLVLLKQAGDFFNRPDVVRDARFRGWRHAECLMHAGEIVEREVERDRGGVILQLLAESVRQPVKATHRHAR